MKRLKKFLNEKKKCKKHKRLLRKMKYLNTNMMKLRRKIKKKNKNYLKKLERLEKSKIEREQKHGLYVSKKLRTI